MSIILLVQARYPQLKDIDNLNVYWNFYPIVPTLFLAYACICVFFAINFTLIL